MSGISAQYVDGLEFRIKELTAQVEKLTKERDEWKGGWEKLGETCEAHTKTIEQLAAFAEQNEKLREALEAQPRQTKRDWKGVHTPNETTQLRDEALSLPDLASPVLNRIRAETLDQAAKWFNDHVDNRTDTWQAQELRRMAAELEKQNA